MAGDRSQLGKVLAEIDRKIAVLTAAKAEVLAARTTKAAAAPKVRKVKLAEAERIA